MTIFYCFTGTECCATEIYKITETIIENIRNENLTCEHGNNLSIEENED